jgi:hypothetical protein
LDTPAKPLTCFDALPDATGALCSRIITYNVFAAYLGTPWRLEVPPNPSGEHLDPDEAAHVIRKLAVQRPPTANEVTWIRIAALVALVAATGRTVRQLVELDRSNLRLNDRPPDVVLEDGPIELDERTVSTLKRWLRQRQALVKRTTEGSDPGYLWLPTKRSYAPANPRTPRTCRSAPAAPPCAPCTPRTAAWS